MATQIAIGFSDEVNVETAAKNAAIEIKTKLETNDIDLLISLSTIHYDPKKAIPHVLRLIQPKKFLGCSAAGLILPKTVETKGYALLGIKSDEMSFGVGSVDNINNQDSRQAGSILAQNNINDFGQQARQLFVFFVDSHLENNSLLLHGIQDVLGNVFPVVGAGNSDNFHANDTFQICQGAVLQNSASGIILGGQMSVGVGSRHGWRPLGKPRTVNRCTGHIIREIDGKKAADLYAEYFGQALNDYQDKSLTQLTNLYPLGIYVEGSKEYLLRNAVDFLQDGSIVCQGDVPEGSEAHIMIGNKESCTQAAIEAAEEAQTNLAGKQAKLVLVFETASRLKIMGRQVDQTTINLGEYFGSEVPIFGMYTYGEICPFQPIEKTQKAHLKNESIVILAIS